ncbi:GAD-like domain-containing protein [Roseospira navarrensis]|uniref:DUF1851 domain-containing protein n=1 Tax=Roseospira navarrensis TaxID=140058 RepID=A0A7X2D3Y6_9PROT|nr:GAD-like domain-containing protein [Roseospira navarrensis]MQX37343.1 DUF1851 domain-containing protein [Roseospira navarrensis]
MPGLARFRDRFGPPTAARPADPAVCERYAARLPAALIEEWRESGWAAYADGRLWLVNPDDYTEAMDEWLPDLCADPDTRPLVFARSAFGDLLVAHDADSTGQLNVHYGRFVDLVAEPDDFLDLLLDLPYLADALDGDLAAQAVLRAGPLAADEMFAFQPALALGGARHLDHVVKVKMEPHLAILVQLFDAITFE